MTRHTLCLFVLIPVLLKSEYSWERSSAELLVQDGIYALYNYEFDNAIVQFDSARKIDDSHPVIPFVLISAKWLKTQTEQGYDASYKVINKEVDSTIPIYRKLIKGYPDDSEMVLYLGSTYGLRARTAMADKDWLGVFYFGYKGLKYIREAQNIDSQLLDVYMPIGLMEYFACLSPAPVQWGAKFVGLSASCEQGLRYLEIAAKQSHYSWIEASNVLTYAYLHIERDYIKAEEIISRLVENFPGHPYFSFMQGELLVKTKQWEKLEIDMPKLKGFAASGPFLKQNECQLKLAYIQALKAFHHGDYSLSIEKCDWMLSNYYMEFDWLKGFAHSLKGKSYEMMDELELAIKDYKEVLKMDAYYPEVEESREKIIEIGERSIN
jgi:tetratricopeptide (TPR) repeat protein